MMKTIIPGIIENIKELHFNNGAVYTFKPPGIKAKKIGSEGFIEYRVNGLLEMSVPTKIVYYK